MTLYLDMDGVIADFFTGFANRFGKDHWKLIQDKEKAIIQLQGTDFFYNLDTFDSSKKLVEFARSTGDWESVPHHCVETEITLRIGNVGG